MTQLKKINPPKNVTSLKKTLLQKNGGKQSKQAGGLAHLVYIKRKSEF